MLDGKFCSCQFASIRTSLNNESFHANKKAMLAAAGHRVLNWCALKKSQRTLIRILQQGWGEEEYSIESILAILSIFSEVFLLFVNANANKEKYFINFCNKLNLVFSFLKESYQFQSKPYCYSAVCFTLGCTWHKNKY